MTIRTTVPWAVQEVPVPASLADDDAWALLAEAELERVVQRAAWGHDDLAYPAADTLEAMREQRYTARTHLMVTHPERPREVIGVAFLRAPLAGNTHLVDAEVLVHPEHRGRGIGTALLAEVESRTRAMGRRLLILNSDHGPEPAADHPAAMTPPTGTGRIARTDPFSRFATAHGFALEQTERYSVLPLPVDPAALVALRAQAQAAAGPDYRVLSWRDRSPDEWVDQLAVLETRMSTDAPSGGVEIEEDPWDAARVRAAEAVSAAAGRGSLVAAALHVPSGTLAGFTALEFPLDSPEVVFQEDTLVLREHRGHRLGQLVKAANLQRLAEVRPGARRVHTWNAEENSYMLRINVALGFRPAGVGAIWAKSVQ